MAVRVTVSPAFRDALVLFNSIELTSTTFLLTVIVQVPDFPPAEAVIMDVPSAMAVTKPALDTVATDCLEDAQRTVLSEASLGSTVALNCTVSPINISAVAWPIVTDVTGTSFSLLQETNIRANKPHTIAEIRFLIQLVIQQHFFWPIGPRLGVVAI